ncbi:hypothetical protein Z043_113894 [Scleropages formosus]|uniref:Uncharacterized protein n=1 Tax=Scleropages formosus TaxID=113540 RepID=A0A0P7YJB2_SCLFO|nr:hypothetical protein Z043_113894 [Scleropages formosus]
MGTSRTRRQPSQNASLRSRSLLLIEAMEARVLRWPPEQEGSITKGPESPLSAFKIAFKSKPPPNTAYLIF